MKASEVLQAWACILSGRTPSLSIELTRECPLRCPGCYAYEDAHLGIPGINLRVLSEYKGDVLVHNTLRLVDEHRPLHVSLVGGDPLVRFRELDHLLPELERRGIHVQLVTSAFRQIPTEWNALSRLNIVVSVDGLQPEHDVRRKPATYERDPKEYRWKESHHSLHGNRADAAAARLSRRLCSVLEQARGDKTNLDQPLHTSARCDRPRNSDDPGAETRHQRTTSIAASLSVYRYAEGGSRSV